MPPETDPIWSKLFSFEKKSEAQLLSFLQRVPIFEEIPKSTLKKISLLLHSRNYKSGETVFTEGDPGVGMYIVQSGQVAISVIEPKTGEETEVARYESGEYFGDVALFSESIRSATVKAAEPSVLLGLCKPDLFNLIKRDPEAGSQILIKLLDLAGKRLELTNRLLTECKRQLKNSEPAR